MAWIPWDRDFQYILKIIIYGFPFHLSTSKLKLFVHLIFLWVINLRIENIETSCPKWLCSKNHVDLQDNLVGVEFENAPNPMDHWFTSSFGGNSKQAKEEMHWGRGRGGLKGKRAKCLDCPRIFIYMFKSQTTTCANAWYSGSLLVP